MADNNKSVTIYCHFSFKRPNKGADGYGLFAVAFYRDFEGKHVIYHVTKKLPLWKNHQFITGIQSYENALRIISEVQGAMKANNINQVMLVTDNSTLAGWIEDPKKNKEYTDYMRRAVEKYKAGAPREITLGLGLCEVREYEKSYKYCTEKYLDKSEAQTPVKVVKSTRNAINISGIKYQTIGELVAEQNAMPTIVGMTET